MASGSEKVGAGGSGGSKGSTKSSGRAKSTPKQGGINSNNPVPF